MYLYLYQPSFTTLLSKIQAEEEARRKNTPRRAFSPSHI